MKTKKLIICFCFLSVLLLNGGLIWATECNQASVWDYPVEENLYIPGSYKGRDFYPPGDDHLGEDIDLPEGKEIKAVASGKIVYYGPASSYGELVVAIEHDLGRIVQFTNAYGETVATRKLLSIYGHVRKSETRDSPPLNLSVGSCVPQGWVIAYINNSSHPYDGVDPDPNGDGFEHLHMGIRLSDKATAIERDGNFWLRGYEGSSTRGTDFASAKHVIDTLKALENPQNKSLVKIQGQDPIYWLQNGKAYHVLNFEAIDNMAGIPGWDRNQIRTYSPDKLIIVQKGEKGGFEESSDFISTNSSSNDLLIKLTTDPKVYRMEDGKRKWIINEAVFNELGYNWDDIIEVTEVIMDQFPQSNPVTNNEAWRDVLDDTRLTFASAYSDMPSLGVDANGNTHIIWIDSRNGNYALYYTKLDKSGNTLVPDTRLALSILPQFKPCLGVDSSGNIHIVWGGNNEIYYTKLDNNGNTLVDDLRLTFNNANSDSPSLVIDTAGNIHIAWVDSRDTDAEIYYTKLDNSGNTLVDDTRLTFNSIDGPSLGVTNPSIGVDNSGNIHISWTDYRNDGAPEIYYMKLDNSGSILVGDTKLTSNGAPDMVSSLAVDSYGNVHIVWNNVTDIYYTKLDNSGNTLVDDTRLTFNSDGSSMPSLAIDAANNLHVVWRDDRDDNSEIYYTKLDNAGDTLVNDTRLTFDDAESGTSSLCADIAGNIHIAWTDYRNADQMSNLNNAEIYYTKGRTTSPPQIVNDDAVRNEDRSLTVTATIVDSDGTVDKSVLYYRAIGMAEYKSIMMQRYGVLAKAADDEHQWEWIVNIPVEEINEDRVEYYIIVEDNEGNTDQTEPESEKVPTLTEWKMIILCLSIVALAGYRIKYKYI